MSNNSEDHHQSDPARHRDGSRQLLWAMADTTWRMFAGPIVMVPAGIYADIKLGTKPWLTILATVVGLAFSVLLVRAQMRGGQ